MKIEHYRMPPQLCGCGKVLDAATGKDGHAPEPGNVSICWGCGQVLQFTAELGLQAMTDDEIATLPAEARTLLRKMQSVQTRAKLARMMGGANG